MSGTDRGLSDQALELLRRLAADRDFAFEKLQRAVGQVRARGLFLGCELGERVSATGPLRVVREGRISIGSRVVFAGGMVPTELVCHGGAWLSIGERSVFNYGVSIECGERITIGARCMFASFVRLCDRSGSQRGPITLGNDVWIAHGAIVEPGVTIGDGSVVSAGSVVTKDVPPHCLAMGNPSRAMRLDAAPPP